MPRSNQVRKVTLFFLFYFFVVHVALGVLYKTKYEELKLLRCLESRTLHPKRSAERAVEDTPSKRTKHLNV